ncbi:hypothetical protein [Yinghuangia seranimata]|uniref:hypothetical protein n=1 Tax=Yinghuangia seranimata TaxID=408067 RepID=UPI00248B9F6B|nr:hypothetical protein [Yinghuangia seranimata]MDI2129970.1 hypothetical protein [Yinghuangia seranimata]
MRSPEPTPPEGSALAEPATRRALRGYRLRAWGLILLGAVLYAAAWAVERHTDVPSPWTLAVILAAGCAVVFGLVAQVQSARMHRVLSRHPWVACACRFHEPGSYPGASNQSVLVLIDPARDGSQHVLAVVATARRARRLRPCDGAKVWFAGDPARGGVVSPPGGGHLLWTRPFLLRPWSRYVKQQATGTNPAGA